MGSFSFLIVILLIIVMLYFLFSVVKYTAEHLKAYPNFIEFSKQNKSIVVTLALLVLGSFYLISLLFSLL